MRQVVLDTETTGLEHSQGHRIIEIGCIEVLHRRITERSFHTYLNPERAIDEGAMRVHGITLEQLADKPRFADQADEFLEFVSGAELIIHNAPFDVGFLDAELTRARPGTKISDHCGVLDTLLLARRMHPGQRNSLDALCQRYEVDNTGRQLHGALLDAELLADVYLRMTGGQVGLQLSAESEGGSKTGVDDADRIDREGLTLKVVQASPEELERHERRLDQLDTTCKDGAVWRREEKSP
jgi:DNA polymerase III subunit epsilon